MQLIGEADLCPEPSGTSSEVFAGGTSIVRNTRRLKIGRALRLKKPNLRTWFVWRAWKSEVLGDRSSSPRSDTLISVCARGGCPSGLFNSHENIHGTCWSLFFCPHVGSKMRVYHSSHKCASQVDDMEMCSIRLDLQA
jgi:hypothetical protein